MKTKKQTEVPALREVGAPDLAKQPLTAAQESLLDVLKDPQVLGLNDVSKICKLAGISRATFYNALKDKNFLIALEDVVQGMLTFGEVPVIKNILQKASDPATQSHHWAQMVLKMKGRLEERTQRPAQVVVNFNVQRPPKMVDNVIEVKAEDIIDN